MCHLSWTSNVGGMQLQDVAQNKHRFLNSRGSTWQSVWQYEMLSKVVENVRMMDENNCMNPIMKSQGQSWTLLSLMDVKLSDVGTADSSITEHLWRSKWLRIPDYIWILQSQFYRKYLKTFHKRLVENDGMCLKTVYTLHWHVTVVASSVLSF